MHSTEKAFHWSFCICICGYINGNLKAINLKISIEISLCRYRVSPDSKESFISQPEIN